MSIASISVSGLLRKTEQVFSEADVPSPRLDAEVLLAYFLGADRSWLVAHGQDELGNEQVIGFENLVERRIKREPVAYITEKKEFYGREFMVTSDVLIPRPESEALIELLIGLEGGWKKEEGRLIDVGCGSGCLGITAKLELPELDVTLCDINASALEVTNHNAETLNANVHLEKSDLLSKFEIRNSKFDIILANLPYVDKTWKRSPETDHEPAVALFADDNGLELIKKLIEQSKTVLDPSGYMVLEADPEQHSDITVFAKTNGFSVIEIRDYAISLKRD